MKIKKILENNQGTETSKYLRKSKRAFIVVVSELKCFKK